MSKGTKEGTTMARVVKPLDDRVLIKRLEAEERTAGGIVLPYSAKEKPTKGKVISVGPGKLDEKGKPMELGVRAGDTVFYGKYSGNEVKIDGVEHLLLREEEVLGVLEK